jgi:hypothetical protein
MTEDSSRATLLKMELVEAIQTGADAFEPFCTLLNRLLSLRRSVTQSRVLRTTKRKRDVRANYYDHEQEAEVNGEEHHQPESSKDEGVLVAGVLNSSKKNLLTKAIKHKLPQFVYSLLEARADPCFVDEKGMPALNRACFFLKRAAWNHPDGPWDTFTPRMLLEYGADVNAMDEDGVTPLYIALRSFRIEGAMTGLWKLLFLDYDADPFILCKRRRLDLSEPIQHETCVELAMRLAVGRSVLVQRDHSFSCLEFLAHVDRKYDKEYARIAYLEMEGDIPPWH